jgi:hypothetical protein
MCKYDYIWMYIDMTSYIHDSSLFDYSQLYTKHYLLIQKSGKNMEKN